MDKRPKGTHCKGKTKEGKPCRAAATPGGLCFFHANPNRASELGRKGGRSKRQLNPEEFAAIPSLDTMKSVHEMSKRLFEEAYSGKRSPRDMNGLVRLLEQISASIRLTNLEERISKLEQERSHSDDCSFTTQRLDGTNNGTDGGLT